MKNYVLVYVPRNADGSLDYPKVFCSGQREVEYYRETAERMGWKVLAVLSYNTTD